MNIVKRIQAPTPKFFKVLRTIGLVLAAPVALPVVIVSIGGYIEVAGGVISAVSQLTTTDENDAYTQQ